jgi:hypothetical protein
LTLKKPTEYRKALVSGIGAITVLAGRYTERHRRCVTPFALLPPGSFSVGQ